MQNPAAKINDIQAVAKKVTNPSALLKPEMVEEFNSVFKEAAAAVANVNSNDFEKKRNKQILEDQLSLDKIDKTYLAQLNAGVADNAADAPAKDMNIVPLQMFLDNAIKSLERVSRHEFKVNNLMDGFVRGEISEDEVILETSKLNLSISMVTTIMQSAVQTFKEIQQIPV